MRAVAVGLDRDGRIVSMNPIARDYIQATFGRDPELGESLLTLAVPGVEDEFVTSFARARDGESVAGRWTIRYPSGLEIVWTVQLEPIWIDGQVRQIFLLALDDTPEVTRTLALRVYREALARSPTAIVLCDAREVDLPILFVNAAFERLTGYASSDVLGRNCRFLQGTDRDQPGLEVLRRALREGAPCETVLRNYRADGSLVVIGLSVAPIRDADGTITHFLGMQTPVE